MVEYYGLGLARILALVGVGYYGTAWLRKKTYTYLSRMYPDHLRSLFVARIVSYAFLFIILSALLHEFGVNLTGILGAAGVAGFAIAYASQTSLSNIISGLLLALERPFEVHDVLIVDNVEGSVEKVTLFSVTLRTHIGTLMRIPHEHLLKNTFINVTRFPVRRFDITVKVAANQEMARVITVIEEAIKNNNWCNKDNPRIIMKELSGNYIALEVGVWTKQKHYGTVMQTFPTELKQAFDTQGVRLATYAQWE